MIKNIIIGEEEEEVTTNIPTPHTNSSTRDARVKKKKKNRLGRSRKRQLRHQTIRTICRISQEKKVTKTQQVENG